LLSPDLDAAPGDEISLDAYFDVVRNTQPAPMMGRVSRVVGLLVESNGPQARIGEVCELRRRDGTPVPVEIVGFRDGKLLSVPLGDTAGIRPGDRIVARGGVLSMPAGDALLGRVIDGLGEPIDGRGPLRVRGRALLKPPAMNPLARESITRPIGTGVRAIDGLLTCGRGQRVGLFGGSGVGKSTLLGMMARGTEADVVVLALVGERGREVRSFIEHDRSRWTREISGSGVDFRQPAARAPARRLWRDGHRRIFPRPGPQRPADDGFGHAFCHGAA
jgi:flagellum-specific ATP synthase